MKTGAVILLAGLYMATFFASAGLADTNALKVTDLGSSSPERLLGRLVDAYNGHDKPPLVLVHGWRGLDSSAPCLTNAPDPANYPDTYWLHLDEDLQAQGFDVTMAKLITGFGFDGSTPGCSPVAEANIPYIEAAIDAALAANPGQDKVILIAHSMGGLVSRAYLESAAYRDDVVELYTLGSPHLGVPINGLVLIGQAITLGAINLNDFCTSQPVACQFSDDEGLVNDLGFTGIATFNAVHSQRRDRVHYHLVGGDADFGDRSNLGAIMDGLISPAPDDGIVPRDSATGINSFNNNLGPLAGPYDRRETYELHVETFTNAASLGDSPQRHFTYFTQDEYVVGCLGFCEELSQELTSESYNGCLEPVISTRLPDHRCNGGTIFPLAVQTPRPQLNAIAPADFETLAEGQSSSRSIWLEGGGAMLFARTEAGSRLAVTLRAPDGSVIDVNSAASDPDVLAKVEENATVYLLLNAQPGQWQLALELTNAPAGSARTMTWASYHSSVEARIHLDRGLYRSGQSGTLTVNLTGAPRQVAVEATIGSGPTSQTVTLTGNGSVYTGNFIAPAETGYQKVRVNLAGATANSIPFEHERRYIFPVAPTSYRLTSRYTDSIQPALNGQTLPPDLVVAIEVAARAAGQVGVAGDLVDSQGNLIATSNTYAAVNAGDHRLALRFRGRDLLRSGRSGPYRLDNVRLIDYSAGGLVVETRHNAHTTAAYERSSFAAAATALPHEIASALTDPVGQIDDSAHHCTVTPSNNSGANLAVGDTFRFDCQINLDSGGQYPEWLDYYYLSGPAGWPMSQQSAAPPNAGGWNEPLTAESSPVTGLAYWGVDYPDPADLDLASGLLPDPGTFWGPWRPDTGTAHPFSLTYAVPNSLPACPGSALVGLPAAGQSVTSVGMGDLLDAGVNARTTFFGGYVCPLPSVSLEVTVSTDGTCPGTAAVSVPEANQTVTFCYALTNTSSTVTVLAHTLANTLIPDSALSLALAPGASHNVAVEATLNEEAGQCYDNNVTWTAETDTGWGQPQGSGPDVPYGNTTYQAVSQAAAKVCVGIPAPPAEIDIYLPLIVK